MTTQKDRPVRVLVVDDSADFIPAASAWVGRHEATALAGTARDGAEAIEATDRLAPDVVLMDISMPLMDGFAATRAIKARAGAPLVIMISFSDGRVLERKARSVGADGFLTKSDFASKLPELLRGLLGRGRPSPSP